MTDSLIRTLVQTLEDETARSGLPLETWLRQASPDYNWSWAYLQYILTFLNRMTAGEIRKLMIFMPPRHGKSALCTLRYPVYRLLKEPRMRVLIGSYSQDLALLFGRQTRRIASSFMDLSRERNTLSDWETPQGGGIRSAGVGVGIAGRGADLIIIDDPVKNRAEADSLLLAPGEL